MKPSKSGPTTFDPAMVQAAVAGSGLIDFLVMFTKEEGPDALILGSGTLVSIDGTKAIRTADHVLQEIKQPSGNVRLLFPTRFGGPQRFRPTSSIAIPMKYLQKRTIARGNLKDLGPDLGLLMLPGLIASRFVPSTKSFYNLSMRRSEVIGSPRAIDTGLWVIMGGPGELRKKTSSAGSGFPKVYTQGLLLGVGCVTREYTQDGFDYLEFLADYSMGYEGPDCFGGCSGGGLWHILFEKEATGEIVVKEKILSGVVFHQSKRKDDKRIVTCHGRNSVYHKVVGDVA